MKEEEIVEKNIWIAEGIRIGRKRLAEDIIKDSRSLKILTKGSHDCYDCSECEFCIGIEKYYLWLEEKLQKEIKK